MYMSVLFTREYWLEREIVKELEKKIKQSKKFEFSADNKVSECKLDNINIIFDRLNYLTVTNKKDEKILFRNCCYFDAYDMSKVRFKWFHNLLKVAEERAGISHKNKKEKVIDKATQEKQKQQMAIKNALQQIRG